MIQCSKCRQHLAVAERSQITSDPYCVECLVDHYHEQVPRRLISMSYEQRQVVYENIRQRISTDYHALATAVIGMMLAEIINWDKLNNKS